MTKLEKIEEILREYDNGVDSSIDALDILEGIRNVMDDPTFSITEEELGRPVLRQPTPAGELVAYVGADLDNPSVGIYLMPEDGDGTVIDLAYAETQGEDLRENTALGEQDVVVYTYADPYAEDYTQKNIIKREDVVKALELESDTPAKKTSKSFDRE